MAPADDGTHEVEIVYGTTRLKFDQRPDDFFVTNVAEMEACGLDRATRFDLDNILWLPWAAEWFEPLHGYSSPVIGRLTDYAVKMLQITVGFRQAKAQRAAQQPKLNLGDGEAGT